MTKTIICDLDGVLVEQDENYMEKLADHSKFKLLPGTVEKLKEWETAEYRLILFTGRKEGSRRITERMLDGLGVSYDQLVMGVGIGPRVLINDLKPGKPEMPTAVAVNLARNKGIGELDI